MMHHVAEYIYRHTVRGSCELSDVRKSPRMERRVNDWGLSVTLLFLFRSFRTVWSPTCPEAGCCGTLSPVDCMRSPSTQPTPHSSPFTMPYWVSLDPFNVRVWNEDVIFRAWPQNNCSEVTFWRTGKLIQPSAHVHHLSEELFENSAKASAIWSKTSKFQYPSLIKTQLSVQSISVLGDTSRDVNNCTMTSEGADLCIFPVSQTLQFHNSSWDTFQHIKKKSLRSRYLIWTFVFLRNCRQKGQEE